MFFPLLGFAWFAVSGVVEHQAIANEVNSFYRTVGPAQNMTQEELSKYVAESADTLRDKARQALWRDLSIALAIAVASLLIFILTIKSVVQPLKRALDTIERSGDDSTLRLEVPGSDELSMLYTAFNDVSSRADTLFAGLKSNGRFLKEAGDQITQGNQELDQQIKAQSETLLWTTSNIEETIAIIEQSADNAKQARRMTESVTQEAQKAASLGSRAQDAMHQIYQANEQVTTVVAAIDSITFQTNLLALNASVEAARAGEQGKGFAVVAQEVRKLANRSSEEANQIRRLIGNNVERINEGKVLVASTNETLGSISQGVQEVADMMKQMTSSAIEQSSEVEDINRTMAQLEKISQQNIALIEEVAASNRLLNEQTAEITQVVDQDQVRETTETLQLTSSS